MRKAYIYFILDCNNADMYIGSCWVERWNTRKSLHKNLELNTCCSKEIIKNNNYIFEIFEENEFDTKEDRFKREQFYIDNNKCINKHRAYVTEEQRIEYYKEKNKKYNENNKEELKKYQKKYREDNKQKSKKYREDNKKEIKEKSKKYREDNKEELIKYRKKYYEEYEKIKINCDICNKLVSRGYIIKHKKSKKCMSHLNK